MLRYLQSQIRQVTGNEFVGPLCCHFASQCRFAGTDAYLNRHIGPTKAETESMLKTVGKDSLEELVHEILPQKALRKAVIQPFHSNSEIDVLLWLKNLASRNKLFKSMIGQGYYECITPTVITHNVTENPMWYTPYTPIHPEISQGRLEAVLNAQTVAAELTSMDIAAAVTPCLATACSEAMCIAYHYHNRKRKKFFVSCTLFSSLIANIQTRAEGLGIQVITGTISCMNFCGGDVAGIIVQTPAVDGHVSNHTSLFAEAKKNDVLCCCVTDLLSCTILVPPGEMGADIVVCSGQRLGLPLGYGGPHVAFLAITERLKKYICGQLIGVSHDDESSGPAIRLVLRDRETYVQKENSLFNIDTAPFLTAAICGFYAIYHGPKGLTKLAQSIHRKTALLAAGFQVLQIETVNLTYFDTITLKLDRLTSPQLLSSTYVANCADKGINVFHNEKNNTVSISVDETTSDYHLSMLLEAAGMKEPNLNALQQIGNMTEVIPKNLRRNSKFLSGLVFQTKKSETELIRYVQRLQRKDFGLTHGMMPMGSSTLKLNSSVVVQPLSWPELVSLHPYAPESQTKGTNALIVEFKQHICDIFGMAACSIQPNSAAQGLYSGLRIIKSYQQLSGQSCRDVCFIPEPDQGTNAASAVLAGLKVVYLKTNENSEINMEDFKEKCDLYGNQISSLITTYPNVCGVFDSNITEIHAKIHAVGGQCLVDGLNMNAMVGYTGPGFIGGDVCAIPLHKTFSIPHAFGGAGICALLVCQHLAPHLPNSVVGPRVGGSRGYGVVSQSGYGSASLLSIPYMLLQLLGSKGAKTCTDYAIINANYLKRRLERDFTVLALSSEKCCAHQFIVDVRPLEKTSGVTAGDIAKRLIDYGCHPPTINFPYEGTLLIEPTESECKHELDRFADAFISIREEIRDVECGRQPRSGNVLKLAPHTARTVTADRWERPYSRQLAAYPSRNQKIEKYWPAVGRVHKRYADEHLLCSSSPLEFYQ